MARPKPKAPDSERILANRIFVDRDQSRTLFAELVAGIPEDSVELLVFYGLSGQGKSALSRELSRMLAQDRVRFGHIRSGLLDLKEHQLTDPALVMLWLRDALAADRELRFPAFDLAFAIYWNAAYPGASMPSFRGGWLSEEEKKTGRDVVRQTFGEIAKGLVESVPFVGSALRRLAEHGLKAARLRYSIRTNESLKPLFVDGEPAAPYKIREQLPRSLSADLEDHRERNPNVRFVILIDEYERLFEHGGLAAAARDNAFDRIIRDFIAYSTGALVTIFSRERLAWSVFKPEWKDWLENAHHLLGGISRQDADTFLKAVPVPEPKSRMAMIESASTSDGPGGEKEVLPVMLDLAVDHYLSLMQGGRFQAEPVTFTIASADFADRRNELLRRFLRQYDNSLEGTLKRLAVARCFDRITAIHLIRKFATGFPLDRLADLLHLSFIHRVSASDYYVMHQVIREGLVALLEPEDLQETQQALLEHFSERARSADPRAIGQVHARALLEAAYFKGRIAPKEVFSWWDEARKPFDSALFAPMFEEFEGGLLASAQAQFGPNDLRVARCLDYVGSNLSAQGQLVEGEKFARHALELREAANLPTNDPDIAKSLNNLANNLNEQRRYREAEVLHRRALKLREAYLSATHPDIATSINNLANSLYGQRRYAEAESLYRRALDLREANLPTNHTNIARSLNNLANNLHEQRRYREAEVLHRRALEFAEATLPATHPDIAISLNNLALDIDRQRRYMEAEPLYRRALELKEVTLSAKHPDIANGLNNLANNLRAQRRYSEAESLRRRAVDLVEADLPATNREAARILTNLAFDLVGQQRYTEAKSLCDRARSLIRGANPPANVTASGAGQSGDGDVEAEHPRMVESLYYFLYFGFLDGLTNEELQILLPNIPIRQFRGGEVLLQQGETSNCIRILYHGTVEVITAERHITLQPPYIFGEFLEPSVASVVARSDVEVLELNAEDMAYLFYERPTFVLGGRGGLSRAEKRLLAKNPRTV